MAGHTSRLKGVTRILQPQLDRIDMEYDEEHTEVNRQCNQYANNKDFVNLQGLMQSKLLRAKEMSVNSVTI